jgi:DNA-binding MarR family transcriptional regulator
MVKIDRANTHRAIKKLEALGFIYTVRDNDDKRVIKSYLTEEGEALMPKIKEDLLSITDMLIKDFDEDQRKDIYILLKKIETNVQKHVKALREESRHEEEQ